MAPMDEERAAPLASHVFFLRCWLLSRCRLSPAPLACPPTRAGWSRHARLRSPSGTGSTIHACYSKLPAGEGTCERSAAGESCDDEETPGLRVRFARSIGLPQRRQRRHASAQVHWEAFPYLAGSLSALAVSAIGTAVGLGPLVWLTGLALATAGALWGAAGWAKTLRLLSPSDTLEDLALAVYEALRTTGGIAGGRGPQDLRVVLQQDGYYRCYLASASPEDGALFAEALDEVLSPLANPRYLIPRFVAAAPRSLWQALGELVRNAIPGRPGAPCVYHAVPAYFGADKQRARAFRRAWNRHVSPGHLLPCQHPRAQAILARQRGQNLFAVTTQLRTLWR